MAQEISIKQYQTRLENGLLREVATQTQDEISLKISGEHLEKDYWKRQVEKIIDHKTQGSKLGVRFMTKWKGYRIWLLERSDIILARGGKKPLIEYLNDLKRDNERRYAWLFSKEPKLAEILHEETCSSGSSQNSIQVAHFMNIQVKREQI